MLNPFLKSMIPQKQETLLEKDEEYEFFVQLKKVGNSGFKTEDLREKISLNQINGIFTIISIYSLIVLYAISFEIIKLEGWKLIIFLAFTYIPLVLSLVLAIKAQIQNGY